MSNALTSVFPNIAGDVTQKWRLTGSYHEASDLLAIEIVFETHSTTADNERGIATGWLPGHLSELGRQQALRLGERRRENGFDAIFTSDLRRAVETVEIAFAGSDTPIFTDWRLRECDYGDLNGKPRATHHQARAYYLDTPYPNGESWRQAIERVGRFLDDLPMRWSNRRVLIIGHIATRWALEYRLASVTLETLTQEKFEWQEGWNYQLHHLPGS